MVFLRLTVKVYPRDPLPSSSTTFNVIRSLYRDDQSRNLSNGAAAKPASFLITLDNPEEVTLGGLAGMIQDKWKKLRPDSDPLDIKKLVDDDHESDDLDADMTVADVFVDNGKARVDGLDQRRTVRVIQRPANTSQQPPLRFPSVDQDWDAAALDYERLLAIKKEKKEEAELRLHQLPTIAEESRRNSGSQTSLVTDVTSAWSHSTSDRTRRRDIPVSSVEKDEIPGSPVHTGLRSPFRGDSRRGHGMGIINGQKRMESQELGGSPPPMRPPTPKQITATSRRNSCHSQNSAGQSTASDILEPDLPALQLERESRSTASPQKPPPQSGQHDVHKVTESEEESEDESEESDEKTSDEGEQEVDKDGDVVMPDEVKKDKTQPSLPFGDDVKGHVENNKKLQPNLSVRETRSRKRKNSEDNLEPNKEPRLEHNQGRATTPITASSVEKPRTPKSAETPNISPSMRGRERGSTFSGVGRRLSFSQTNESPKTGLGLGITKSPSKEPPVILDLSQDSAPSGDEAPASTPYIPSSVPSAHQGSHSVSTPLNTKHPADKVKNLHSALRKDASVERSAERRSVSFVEDVLITGSGPAPPKSSQQSSAAVKSPKGATNSGSGKRLSNGSTMNFPAGVSSELIDKYMREANEKTERKNRERAEFEEKIKAAQEQKKNPQYLAKLRAAYQTWQKVDTAEKGGRQSDKANAAKLRKTLKEQQKELEKLEAAMAKTTPKTQQTKKISQPTKPSPSQSSAKRTDSAATAPPTTTTNPENEVEAVTQVTPWKAINSEKTNPASSSAAKSTTPKSNGKATSRIAAQTKPTTTTSTPTPLAIKSEVSLPQKYAAPSQSQDSNVSDDLELPAMGPVQRARRNSTISTTGSKKFTPSQEPVTVDSTSSSSSSSEEETSSDEDDSTDSEGSNEESNKNEAKGKDGNTPNATNNQPRSASINSRSPGQATSKSPVTRSISQSQSQSQPPASSSQPWSWPPSSSSRTRERVALKDLLVNVKQDEALRDAPPPRPTPAPRRDIFSPSGSDSDPTESESSSSEDDDDESSESGDDGDIMSSGQVRKLKNPRRK